MPFAKLAVSITLTIILIIPIVPVSSSLSSAMRVKASASPLLPLSYVEIRGVVTEAGEKHGADYIEVIDNNVSSSPLQSANLVQGTLIVTAKVVNEGDGNKKPSDFTITVHGNNLLPVPFMVVQQVRL